MSMTIEPATTVALTDTVQSFATNGFAVAEDLLEPEELDELRAAYDDLLSGAAGDDSLDRSLGGLTRQIMQPQLSNPLFSDHPVIDRARAIASHLVGIDNPPMLYAMLIYKPPLHPHETPWHQDMAYAGRPFTPAGAQLPNDAIAQFWLALDDVDRDMGCMEFIPGVQDQPMPEHFVSSGDPDDEGRLLAIVNPDRDLDLKSAVPCPLRAGSATVHGYATPHYTGPNRSDTRGRRAFIFSFASPTVLEELASERGDWPRHQDQEQ
ncbi:MAG: phytanoyl-CoA dioxygenase family protein [Pseudomonadota bacterium]